MCGIVGTAGPGFSPARTEQVLREMNLAIAHRGPDDEGFFVSEEVGLGMCRLSIIDLQGGHQPIWNEDRSVAVVFNGEIYNYRELRTRLRQRGHRLATASDTEVIVHLYEELGDECVHELRGMFAFALWDSRRRRLFIARDRLGIKPLYYTQVGERLIFASEIKAILEHPGVSAARNLEAISHFLSLKYVPSPLTMFEGISSLPPGHSLSWDPRGSTLRRYWELSYADPGGGRQSEAAYAEQLEHLLGESVRLRLRSDVPFGAFLSGGVDSSSVVALMSRYLDQPVKTFSVGFESREGESDELPYARLVAREFQAEHREVTMGPKDLSDLAERVTWHLDQPIADQATLATFMVSKLASRHVKMVLTGEGGDELFAGYARHVGERLSAVFGRMPGFLKAVALSTSARLPGMRRPKIALYALSQDAEAARFTNWFPLFNRTMKEELLSEEFARELAGATTEALFAEHLSRTDAVAPLNRMLYLDTKLWLPDFLLARGDKMSMANSLEARVPLLDHELVEFAASLPPDLKLRGLTRKYLLKKVSRAWLPSPIIDRKKQGFPIPISNWLRNESRDFLRDMLSAETLKRRGLFRLANVERLLAQHEAGQADHGALLWGLIGLELWHRLFLDSPPRSRGAVVRND